MELKVPEKVAKTWNRPEVEVSSEMQDLIAQLLKKNPAERMGAKNGAEEILGHEIFK